MAIGTPAGVYVYQVNVTTTGTAGSATGSTTTGTINGFLIGVYLNYHASAPATTDATLAYATPHTGSIIVASNTATDAFHLPRKQASDATAAAITGVYDVVPVSGTLTLSLAQCDALTDAVVAYIYYLKA